MTASRVRPIGLGRKRPTRSMMRLIQKIWPAIKITNRAKKIRSKKRPNSSGYMSWNAARAAISSVTIPRQWRTTRRQSPGEPTIPRNPRCDRVPSTERLCPLSPQRTHWVESRTGAVAVVSRWLCVAELSHRRLSPVWLGSVFLFPLIEADRRFSRIRLSERTHVFTHGRPLAHTDHTDRHENEQGLPPVGWSRWRCPPLWARVNLADRLSPWVALAHSVSMEMKATTVRGLTPHLITNQPHQW